MLLFLCYQSMLMELFHKECLLDFPQFLNVHFIIVPYELLFLLDGITSHMVELGYPILNILPVPLILRIITPSSSSSFFWHCSHDIVAVPVLLKNPTSYKRLGI